MGQFDFKQLHEEILSSIKHATYHMAIEQAAGMVALARLHNEERYLMLGKYLLGICYYYQHDYHSSMEKYLELTNLVLESTIDPEELEFHPGFLDRVRYAMAVNMYHLGDLDGAAIVLQHLLKTAKNFDIILDSVILLGVIYLMMFDVSQTVNFLMVTLEMYLTLLEEVTLPRPKEAMIHNNLAVLFAYRGEYNKAQDMLNNAYVQVTEPIEFFSIFNEMTRIHIAMHHLEKARKTLEKAKSFLGQCTDTVEEGNYYVLSGMLQKEAENYLEAQRLMEKGYYLAQMNNDWPEQTKACRELVALYEKTGKLNDTGFIQEYKALKEEVNLIKEVVKWADIWQDIKARVSLSPILKEA